MCMCVWCLVSTGPVCSAFLREERMAWANVRGRKRLEESICVVNASPKSNVPAELSEPD